MRHQTWMGSPSAAITAMASNRLLEHRLSKQFGGTPGHDQFELQLSDLASGRDPLGAIGGGEAVLLGGIDQFLLTPVVDRLAADVQVTGHVGDRAARLNEI
ncbi:hypothetical protein [Streptosporangium sp. H16]|uniref:hypothetical protein n=1 Tax=Streptosporangium sp. H16 TaxID=3444184 RepID=UPI003F7A7985